jgi:hypothetical protein
MHKQLRANVAANLIFYRRNKLVGLIALLFLVIWAMSSLPSILFGSAARTFEMIRMTVVEMQWFVNIFVAALGVLAVSYNLNHRCLKMVITKPCPPAIWLLGNLLAALLISAILHALTLAVAAILFIAWHIPFQWGILYVTVDGFLRSVIIFSTITFLVSVLHPVVAVVAMLVFSEGMFYQLALLASAALKGTVAPPSKALLVAAKWLAYGLYMALPTFTPYSEETSKIYSTLHLEPSCLGYLGATLVYAIAFGVLSFLLTDWVLRRRRHT